MSENDDALWRDWSYGSFPLTETSRSDNNHPRELVDSDKSTDIWYDPWDPLWMKTLSDESVQRGIAVLSNFATNSRKETFQKILRQRSDRVRFVFENPNNPNNVWATLRTFDSFGLQFVDVIFNPKEFYTTSFRSNEMNTALGSQKWMTLFQHHSARDCLLSLKQQGYVIVATDLHQSSVSLPEVDFKLFSSPMGTEQSGFELFEMPKVAIVLGNELTGITDEVRQVADRLVYLPMKGFAHSLNLSVAAAIICTIVQSKGLIQPSLTDSQRDRILFVWLVRSIKNSLRILRQSDIQLQTKAK